LGQKGLTMRKVRDLLRLCWEGGLSSRQAARSLGIASSTASEHLQRARRAGLDWAQVQALDDEALEAKLFPHEAAAAKVGRSLPDIAYLKRELAKPDVTLMLMWEEYRRDHPDGYQYSRFCELVGRELRRLDLVLRQDHRGGEKTFVDWAGRTVSIVDMDTGETRPASIFVAVLGASSYTFLEAFPDQKLASWIRAHVHAYEFFGGVTTLTIPDNTKTAVKGPNYFEPELHPLYEDLASHYGTAILPARVRRPRDKAKVEVAVQVVQRWVLARLRNRTFFSLNELNAALAELRAELNDRPFRHMRGSRRSLFEEIDRPVLRPLPAERYQWVDWRTAKVGPDYHVQFDQRLYSVPFRLVGEQVELRVSPAVVEVLHKGRRVASHLRAYGGQRFVTAREHMPSSHRRYAEWTPERMRAWAAEVGPATAELVAGLLERRPHPEQGFRSALGVIRLAKTYPTQRVEAACRRAVELGAYSYRSVQSLLRSGLDQRPAGPAERPQPLPLHENIRGSAYYGEGK
jgi:transposase